MKRQPSGWEKIIANENNCQGINVQNIEATHAAQYQKSKQTNRKVGGHVSKEDIQRANRDMKDVQHHSLLGKCKSKLQ